MLFAHPQHGFHNAPEGDAATLRAQGWEPCSDPIEYKRRVWGIDKPAEFPEVELSTEAEQVEFAADIPKKRGRPPKVK